MQQPIFISSLSSHDSLTYNICSQGNIISIFNYSKVLELSTDFMSLAIIKNKTGPKMIPCGTTLLIGEFEVDTPSHRTICHLENP